MKCDIPREKKKEQQTTAPVRFGVTNRHTLGVTKPVVHRRRGRSVLLPMNACLEKISGERQFALSARCENARSKKALSGKDVCAVKAKRRDGQKGEPDDRVKSIFLRARCAEGLQTFYDTPHVTRGVSHEKYQ